MTDVRFVFPKPRLNALLRAPGGLAVADALAKAEENLESIRPSCMAELLALLEMSEARVAVATASGRPKTRETVAIDTPARRATSWTVVMTFTVNVYSTRSRVTSGTATAAAVPERSATSSSCSPRPGVRLRP